MIKKHIYNCDICGQEKENIVGKLGKDDYDNIRLSVSGFVIDTALGHHFCFDCANKIIDYIKSLKVDND